MTRTIHTRKYELPGIQKRLLQDHRRIISIENSLLNIISLVSSNETPPLNEIANKLGAIARDVQALNVLTVDLKNHHKKIPWTFLEYLDKVKENQFSEMIQKMISEQEFEKLLDYIQECKKDAEMRLEHLKSESSYIERQLENKTYELTTEVDDSFKAFLSEIDQLFIQLNTKVYSDSELKELKEQINNLNDKEKKLTPEQIHFNLFEIVNAFDNKKNNTRKEAPSIAETLNDILTKIKLKENQIPADKINAINTLLNKSLEAHTCNMFSIKEIDPLKKKISHIKDSVSKIHIMIHQNKTPKEVDKEILNTLSFIQNAYLEISNYKTFLPLEEKFVPLLVNCVKDILPLLARQGENGLIDDLNASNHPFAIETKQALEKTFNLYPLTDDKKFIAELLCLPLPNYSWVEAIIENDNEKILFSSLDNISKLLKSNQHIHSLETRIQFFIKILNQLDIPKYKEQINNFILPIIHSILQSNTEENINQKIQSLEEAIKKTKMLNLTSAYPKAEPSENHKKCFKIIFASFLLSSPSNLQSADKLYTIKNNLRKLNKSLKEIPVSETTTKKIEKYTKDVTKINEAVIEVEILHQEKAMLQAIITFADSFNKQYNKQLKKGFDILNLSLSDLLLKEELQTDSLWNNSKWRVELNNKIDVLMKNKVFFFTLLNKYDNIPVNELLFKIKNETDVGHIEIKDFINFIIQHKDNINVEKIKDITEFDDLFEQSFGELRKSLNNKNVWKNGLFNQFQKQKKSLEESNNIIIENKLEPVLKNEKIGNIKDRLAQIKNTIEQKANSFTEMHSYYSKEKTKEKEETLDEERVMKTIGNFKEKLKNVIAVFPIEIEKNKIKGNEKNIPFFFLKTIVFGIRTEELLNIIDKTLDVTFPQIEKTLTSNDSNVIEKKIARMALLRLVEFIGESTKQLGSVATYLLKKENVRLKDLTALRDQVYHYCIDQASQHNFLESFFDGKQETSESSPSSKMETKKVDKTIDNLKLVIQEIKHFNLLRENEINDPVLNLSKEFSITYFGELIRVLLDESQDFLEHSYYMELYTPEGTSKNLLELATQTRMERGSLAHNLFQGTCFNIQSNTITFHNYDYIDQMLPLLQILWSMMLLDKKPSSQDTESFIQEHVHEFEEVFGECSGKNETEKAQALQSQLDNLIEEKLIQKNPTEEKPQQSKETVEEKKVVLSKSPFTLFSSYVEILRSRFSQIPCRVEASKEEDLTNTRTNSHNGTVC